MQEILSRLSEHTYDILIFGNECILSESVEAWPIVDCLISFYSTGFPLHKAIEYSELRKPYLINDLKMQYNLQDRRMVYKILESNQIAVPRYVSVERDEFPDTTNVIEEYDEYIVLNGVQLNKPLVEKPVDADDHNVSNRLCLSTHLSVSLLSSSPPIDLYLLSDERWWREQAALSKDRRSQQ
jgi:inositol-hexakisphosphate/diphosphoinositol-pentakisphosphate 1-kinase